MCNSKIFAKKSEYFASFKKFTENLIDKLTVKYTYVQRNHK